jgi:hypothetical protein
VNANPSGSRTPSTGGWGRSKARRELAETKEPSPGCARLGLPSGVPRGSARAAGGCGGGKRHAMMVCRGALSVRRAAQGRVGDARSPRHIATHLARHRLLSAQTSAPLDAARPITAELGKPRPAEGATVRNLASQSAAQPGIRLSPRSAARDNELVQPCCDVPATLACRHSPPNGVLAA